jgi:hypothetical protein
MKRLAVVCAAVWGCVSGGSCFAAAVISPGDDNEGAESLAQRFLHPAASDYPGIIYYRNAGVTDLHALKADIDAFAQAGLHSILLGHLNDLSVNYHMSEPMRPWMKTLVERLHANEMKLSVFNMPGWSGSGGPWIPLEKAARKLAYARIRVTGSGSVDQKLPVPAAHDLSMPKDLVLDPKETVVSYRDIAVLAVPVSVPAECDPQLQEYTLTLQKNSDAPVRVTLPFEGQSGNSLLIAYSKPVTVSSIVFMPGITGDLLPMEGDILAEKPDGRFEPAAGFCFPERSALTVSFPAVTARRFRIFFRSLQTQGGGNAKAASGTFALNGLTLRARPMLDHLEWRNGGTGAFWKDFPDNATDAANAAGLAADDVIDLTGSVDADGVLRCDLPAGNWEILRLGHCFSGTFTHPTGPRNRGYECDKLDPSGIEAHFAGYVNPYVKLIRELSPGPVLDGVHIDSWEQGSANWTPKLPEYFEQKRGYSLMPWLPVLAGEVVGSREMSRRFLWDFRRTLADLVAENYYGRASELAAELGLVLSAQASGPRNRDSDPLLNWGQVDVIHHEFWFKEGWNPQSWDIQRETRLAASALHLYGKQDFRDESFSSYEYFREHLRNLKALADVQLAAGLVGFDLHVGIAQPDGVRAPGSGPTFGTAFNRHNTWWPYMDSFSRYLARCRTLLRRGVFQSDVLWYLGDGMENQVAAGMKAMNLTGYNFDFINTDRLMDLRISPDGGLRLPGISTAYRILVLPDQGPFPFPVLEKIEQLVGDGALVAGNPPDRFGGLAGYPERDVGCRDIVKRLWGSERVVCGEASAAILNRTGIDPDAQFGGARPDAFRFIHRCDGTTHVYFIANAAEEYVRSDVSLRVAGETVTVWDPVRGSIVKAAGSRQENGRTVVPLTFAPQQSLFVVVASGGITPEKGVAIDNRILLEAEPVKEFSGPWNIGFERPDGSLFSETFPDLISWTEHPDEAVRNFSGSARYRKNFTVAADDAGGKGLYLDLGRVEALCEVRINGESAGVLWCPPYALDISGRVREGENTLEVEVVNTWFNRFARDANLPAEKRVLDFSNQPPVRTIEAKIASQSPMPSGLLGPVRLVRESHHEPVSCGGSRR